MTGVDYIFSDYAISKLRRRGIDEQLARSVIDLGEAMKVTYDQETDTLNVILRDDCPVAESDEAKPGLIFDYDNAGNLISFEIMDASKKVTDAKKIEFQAVP